MQMCVTAAVDRKRSRKSQKTPRDKTRDGERKEQPREEMGREDRNGERRGSHRTQKLPLSSSRQILKVPCPLKT